jgi:hypothetical protein
LSRNPCAFAGPQPKHVEVGSCASWKAIGIARRILPRCRST